jgi:hypothetical protein
MAFPIVASAVRESFAGLATSHAVDMPATVNSGDLLIVHFTNFNATFTVTTPGGWTQLFSNGNPPSGLRVGAYYKIAAGTEDGTTVDFVTSDLCQAISHTYRITNWHGTTPPEVGTIATGTSTTPDPPTLTPSWGAVDTLWIACYGLQFASANEPTAPTNYMNRTWGQSDSGGSTVGGATATRELNATSDNPGTFTSDISDDWGANTIAVRPGSGGGTDLSVGPSQIGEPVIGGSTF